MFLEEKNRQIKLFQALIDPADQALVVKPLKQSWKKIEEIEEIEEIKEIEPVQQDGENGWMRDYYEEDKTRLVGLKSRSTDEIKHPTNDFLEYFDYFSSMLDHAQGTEWSQTPTPTERPRPRPPNAPA